MVLSHQAGCMLHCFCHQSRATVQPSHSIGRWLSRFDGSGAGRGWGHSALGWLAAILDLCRSDTSPPSTRCTINGLTGHDIRMLIPASCLHSPTTYAPQSSKPVSFSFSHLSQPCSPQNLLGPTAWYSLHQALDQLSITLPKVWVPPEPEAQINPEGLLNNLEQQLATLATAYPARQPQIPAASAPDVRAEHGASKASREPAIKALSPVSAPPEAKRRKISPDVTAIESSIAQTDVAVSSPPHPAPSPERNQANLAWLTEQRGPDWAPTKHDWRRAAEVPQAHLLARLTLPAPSIDQANRLFVSWRQAGTFAHFVAMVEWLGQHSALPTWCPSPLPPTLPLTHTLVLSHWHESALPASLPVLSLTLLRKLFSSYEGAADDGLIATRDCMWHRLAALVALHNIMLGNPSAQQDLFADAEHLFLEVFMLRQASETVACASSMVDPLVHKASRVMIAVKSWPGLNVDAFDACATALLHSAMSKKDGKLYEHAILLRLALGFVAPTRNSTIVFQASKEKRAIADGQCVTAANFLRERLEKVACSPESEAGSATRKLLVKLFKSVALLVGTGTGLECVVQAQLLQTLSRCCRQPALRANASLAMTTICEAMESEPRLQQAVLCDEACGDMLVNLLDSVFELRHEDARDYFENGVQVLAAVLRWEMKHVATGRAGAPQQNAIFSFPITARAYE
ncbi:uncharacterized protein MONBRDRAFT_25392 [Monosiga brevicollis MX1]|uniref:Uncharacterized protein n=1 Tax=Monosiga brevicollis TaxID=81824 RepID=A9UZA2_MONBE|nr:uncharacterized protein MONBRDRAFT_25392 [Monosiga brevicollis MX1]EDQ89196.1 predicted protein [Monosiga brevicollis MX1]|eukprot:XP_001745772.1 hypothetical protein [Monosiga brevicollis MX1]